jgi:hypothetical protein
MLALMEELSAMQFGCLFCDWLVGWLVDWLFGWLVS